MFCKICGDESGNNRLCPECEGEVQKEVVRLTPTIRNRLTQQLLILSKINSRDLVNYEGGNKT